MHEFLELFWLVLAQILDRSFFLLLFDICVLLRLGSTWQTLPRERSFQEVKDDVTDGLQVISPRLLNALVGGN